MSTTITEDSCNEIPILLMDAEGRNVVSEVRTWRVACFYGDDWHSYWAAHRFVLFLPELLPVQPQASLLTTMWATIKQR